MKKLSPIIGIILFLVAIIFIVNFFVSVRKPTATIDNRTFYLYTAKTEKDKQIGLSRYDKLPQDHGMLFMFEKKSFPSFWMKNMKFPIDIIFINGDTIADVAHNVPRPQTDDEDLPIYKPKSSVDKALEINAGLANEYGFSEGDKVIFKNL